jgi:polysaccharide export outer membrane protein
MCRTRWVLQLWLWSLSGLAVGVLPAGSQAQSGGEASEFRLRSGDAIRLLVRDEPELTGEYPVLEDGTVLLPLIGLVPVAGVAFEEVESRVRSGYARELVAREVVVQPLLRVQVTGEVRQPGLYLVDATYALGDVVARAGGLTPSANARKVQLRREGRTERHDLGPRGSGVAVPLRPADAVFVPRQGWVGTNAPVLIGAATSVLAAAVTALLVR